ncbi:ankyrin repeat domain-containing protein [Bacillus sp. EB01]|uniref:ankyrin repeat domain-containing protein n=1 Tax=Bacillus sp. EB01 TaxID=1347086 RepID=UPI0005C78954|nr:ankyrin repeat domain-containing protein [Bacillus sp. EB01]
MIAILTPNEFFWTAVKKGRKETILTQLPHVTLTDQEACDLLARNGYLKIDSLYSLVFGRYSLASQMLNRLLHGAILNQYEYGVKVLLQQGAEVNNPNHFGIQPINNIIPYSRHRPEIIQTLLEYGADPNVLDRNQSNPVQKALTYGRTDILEILKAYGAIVGREDLKKALSYAAQSGDRERVDLLLKIGAPITHHAYFWCCMANQYDMAEYLLSKDDSFSLYTDEKLNTIPITAYHGQLDLLKEFLKRGRSNTSPENTRTILSIALYSAIEAGLGHIVKYLVEQGADINYVDEEETPYDYAVSTGQHFLANTIRHLGGKRYHSTRKVIKLH